MWDGMAIGIFIKSVRSNGVLKRLWRGQSRILLLLHRRVFWGERGTGVPVQGPCEHREEILREEHQRDLPSHMESLAC